MTILAICYGTYCDLSSMIYSLRKVEEDIIVVTNVSSMSAKLVPKNIKIEIVIDHSKLLSNISMLNKFISNAIVYSEILEYPKLYKTVKNIYDKIAKLYDTYNISTIYTFYHNISILYTLPYDILKNIKLFILCLAPYYINNKLPYPLSYNNTILGYKKNISSEFTKQDSSFKALRVFFWKFTSIDDILATATYIIAFNRKIATALPDKEYYKSAKFTYVNSIIEIYKDTRIPKRLVKYLQDPGIFITFGSFSADKEVLERLLGTISDYCETNNIYAIYHNPKIEGEYKRIIRYSGYLSYSAIIPKIRLLVYTGSYCIANIAAYYGIPNLYIPQLYEQYFWANLYYNKTGIAFIDKNTEADTINSNMISRAISSKRVINNIRRVKESMDLRAQERIADLIKK